MTVLTELRLLQLAKSGALERWSRENKRLKRLPNNDITKHKEQKALAELREIEKLLAKAEKAQEI